MPENFPNKNEVFGRITDLDVSPLEYYKLVGNFNLLIQREVMDKLAQHTDKLGSVTIVTLGSDARLEKGSFMSPLEVIAITNMDIDLDIYGRELTKIVNNISPTVMARVIETKGPQSSLVTAFNGSYQPGRIADSRLIYGSPNAVQNTKVKLGHELISLQSDKVHHISNLRRNARKIVERGRNSFSGNEAIHFDLKSGIVFYNPEAYQLSFKVGPLRFIQNTLLIEEVKHARRENDPNFVSTLNANIVDRLHQLSDDKMVNLSQSSIDELAEHYAFFLRLYHRSEKMYEQNQQIAMQLNPTEIEEVARRLQALIKLLEKFEIKHQSK